ncbi:hypothetical protein CTheo_4020 [Ceratobasidium theobromae]|uniref:Uncharacterized protein n=1 Tax=Ceratobasidium theobromae TaxID=1582974 RepID=A0A5N5QLW9_9AGAM|nr:hypothetical protein CTheo_4020 [Ceratobasidium theobromae]
MTVPQLFPFHIDYDGPAPVNTYFSETKDENGNKTAAFRGRSLYGMDLTLPDGYTGAVLSTDQNASATDKSSSKDEGGANGTRLEVVSTFSGIGLWRADVPVDPNADEYARALDEWTRMVKLVHAPDEE